MALYQEFIFRDLQIPENFFQENAEVVREHLKCAASELDREHGDIFAINQCLHLGSSVVLRNSQYLYETLGKVRSTEGFEAMDPATLLTVATLYFILRGEYTSASEGDDLTDTLQRLRQRFDDINWLIGRDAMRQLAIEPLEPSAPPALS